MYGYLVGRETHRAITLVVRWLVVLIEFCAVNLGTLGVFLSPNIHIFIHTYAYSSLGPLRRAIDEESRTHIVKPKPEQYRSLRNLADRQSFPSLEQVACIYSLAFIPAVTPELSTHYKAVLMICRSTKA